MPMVSKPVNAGAVTPDTPLPQKTILEEKSIVERVKDVVANPPTKYGKPLGAYELETDRRIHVSGIMQAVAASSALVPFILKQEDYSKVVIEETRKLLKAAQEFVEKGF